MRRMRAALAGLIVGVLLLGGSAAESETYPSRPVRVIVPFPPGGPGDTLARILADKIAPSWGQPLLIDNRGGAGGNIGSAAVARAAPDGYTLLLHASNLVLNANFYDDMPFDAVKDFTPISGLAFYMLVLDVHPATPARTLAEFVALAKARPGGLTMANTGTGSPTHLAAALFRQVAGINLIDVPYQGAAPANTALLAGETAGMFNNPLNTLPFLPSGKLHALAVTGATRLALLPDVPTIAESGYPGFEAGTWYGLFGPAHLPPDIVATLHAQTIRALRLPDVAARLAEQGWNILASPPDVFAAFVAAESDKWARVVRTAGIKTK
ncbi:MAG: tripartite tricarboxylate transporter substrate binding protein [Pseudomonadota bacterium]